MATLGYSGGAPSKKRSRGILSRLRIHDSNFLPDIFDALFLDELSDHVQLSSTYGLLLFGLTTAFLFAMAQIRGVGGGGVYFEV